MVVLFEKEKLWPLLLHFVVLLNGIPSNFADCGDDGRMYDIVFVIDDSRSVDTSSEYPYQRTFLKSLVNYLEIGSYNTLVGLIQVDTTSDVIFNLGSQTTSTNTKSAINGATSRFSGASGYENGANYAYNTHLSSYRRSGSIGIVLGISDDPTISSATMSSYISSAESNGDTFIMIGVGQDCSMAATSEDYYFYVSGFSSLSSSLASQVADKICPAGGGDDGTKYDIIFALDFSGSLSTSDWNDQVDYVNAVIDKFAFGSQRTLAGVMTITNSYSIKFNLGTYTTATATKNAISALNDNPTGSSDYEQGATVAYNTMLQNYRRSGSVGFIIGLSDDHTGVASSFTSLISTAASNGDYFTMVGVQNSMSSAATSSDYYWFVNDWDDVTTSMANSLVSKLTERDCGTAPSLSNGYVTSSSTSGGSFATYSCNTGYEGSTSTLQIYCYGPSWESITFTCNIKDCGTPSSKSYATHSSTGTTYGSTTTYTCNTGYYGSNSNNVIDCRSSGSWESTSFSCQIQNCGNPSSISQSSYTKTGTTYQNTATYTCNTGYDPTSSVNTITCQSDGTWSSTSMTCQIKDCGAAATIAHSSQSGSSTTYGSRVTYSCDTGYSASSNDDRTECQSTGQWSTISFSCTIKDCGTPTSKSNAQLSYTTTTYLSTATYTCDTGYEGTNSYNTINCQSSGSWSSTSFSCQIKDCGNPSSVSNGQYSTTATTYQGVATYTCDTGYTASGTNTITCLHTGSWDTLSFSCIIVDCGQPPVVSDSTNTNTGTKYQDTATYTCDSNYVLTISGAATVSCQSSGSWETPSFNCVYECGTPSSITHATVTYSQTTETNTATYACDLGYNPATNALTITCNVGGWSSSAAIICNINDCQTPPDLANSGKSFTTTTYLSTATYTCDYGHNPSTSPLTITCTPTTWDTITFSCDPNDCGTPSSVTNSETPTYAQTVYPYNATYTCSLGYHLSDPTLGSIMCGPSTWEAITFTCEPNDCLTPPDLVDATNSYTTTTYLSTVTYTCDPGHDPSTSPLQITCEPFAWENITFECIPKDCGPPLEDVEFSTKDYTTTIFKTVSTSIVRYVCNIGYVYEPETATGEIECQVTGVWTTVDFTCIFNYCENKSKQFKDPSDLAVSNDNLTGQMYFLNDTLYTVDCCGVISGWEFMPLEEGFVNLMVWKTNSEDKLELVGFNTVLITNTSVVMNFTSPSNEKLAVEAKYQIGWYFEKGSMIPFATCDTNVDPDCPQETLHAPGVGTLTEGMTFDWSTATILSDRAYAIKFYFTLNTPLAFSTWQYNGSAADHWSVDRAILTVGITGVDYAEEANYTLIPSNSSLDYFYIDGFGTIKIKRALPRSKVTPEFLYNLTAVDKCQNFAVTSIQIRTYNSPPLFTNLPSTIEITEGIGEDTFLFEINVTDPTDDPICCTLEKVFPQSLNFILKLDNSKLSLYTAEDSFFSYDVVNSYLIRICCQDEEYGASGVLQVTIKSPEKSASVDTPGWFFTSLIASLIPISMMFLLSCGLLGYTVFIL